MANEDKSSFLGEDVSLCSGLRLQVWSLTTMDSAPPDEAMHSSYRSTQWGK